MNDNVVINTALGNTGKSISSGPGSVMFDATAFRTFPIRERLALQFRTDAFNALKHPTFSNPSTSPTSTDFGDVTGSGGGRALQLSANLNF